MNDKLSCVQHHSSSMIMQLLFVTSAMVFEYSTVRLSVCIYRYSAAGQDLPDARPQLG